MRYVPSKGMIHGASLLNGGLHSFNLDVEEKNIYYNALTHRANA